MIRRPLAAFAAMIAPLMGSFQQLREVPQQPLIDLWNGNRSTRGPGRRRAGRKVPRANGIAHPPTARLRACGHWGRR